ncbi:MAG: S8 family serine peptidase [Phycisphaerales bacterium]|nr:MAG: S8 family serine peptidase [Phycisphaerales bacterium]
MSKHKSCGVKRVSASALVLAVVLLSKGVHADAAQPVATATSYISIYETGYPNGIAEPGDSKIHRTLDRALADAEPGETLKTWVFFRDKGIATTDEYSAAVRKTASTYNQRAIDRRRMRRTLPGLFDERDLSLASSYIAQVKATGARVRTVSKWLNAVSVYATRDQIAQISALPTVKSMQPVRRFRLPEPDYALDASEARETNRVSGQLRGGGETCASATVIPGIPFHDTGTTVGFVDDYHEVCPSAASEGAPDVVYAYTAPADIKVTIELCNGSDYDTKLYVYENTCDAGTSIACDDDNCGYFYGSSAIYDLTLLEGNTYYLVIDGESDGGANDAGNYVIDITEGGSWYGEAHLQLTQLNLPAVHELGFTGKNVVIAVIDTGFELAHSAFNDPTHPLKVIAEWDFVEDDPNTSAEPDDFFYIGYHGTEVLGTIGAYTPEELVAGAYDASFILCRTYDYVADYIGEEDYFVAALEYIEARGADVATESLDYFTWDDPEDNYTQEDLDGLTTTTTIAINNATDNGVHFCAAAGNKGHDADPATSHIIAPCDAFDAITVGAVDRTGATADFSSDGPTADGRVKPEVMACGSNTRTVDPIAGYGYMGAGGTSYSTPMTAGAVACLVQAFPDWSVQKMREALFSTADYYVANGTFDPLYIRGYGIIDTLAALRADCNDNDVDDLTDISGGSSLDCNGNDIPDECEADCDGDDIPDDCETFTDCNGNGLPDECDLDCDGDSLPDDCEADPAEQDCDADGICNGPHISTCPVDNVFCADCNANGIPDACDIRARASADMDGDHIPDECCLPPAYASPPHDTRKNRYISVDPNTNGFHLVAMQISLSSMLRCSGDPAAACSEDSDCEPGTGPCAEHPSVGTVLGWIGAPWDASCYGEDGTPNGNPCTGEYLTRVVDEPVFMRWPTVHIADCQIVPVATYDLRLTKDGTVLSEPLPVGTILKAAPWHYGDTVGVGTGDLPPLPGFTPPNQIVNVNDVTAYLLTAKGDSTPSVHPTWVDVHGLGDGAPPNYLLNVSDLQRILFGLEGQRYSDAADQLDPGDCP